MRVAGKTFKSTALIYLFSAGICLISLLAFMGGGAVYAVNTQSCVTDKCHSNMGKEKFVHGPAAVGQCVSCHVQEGKHKFLPINDVASLCYKCHDRVDTQKAVHSPVKAGKCTLCHDPHQSPFKFQLREDGTKLCFMC